MEISASIGSYEIRSEIGRSDYAVVYRVWDIRGQRDAVLKLLASSALEDPTIRARYQRELQIIALLGHTCIVPVYEFGEQKGQPYIVMPYLPGGSLKKRLEMGPVSPDEATLIIQRIASALDAVHALGITHGDLKPSNILFDQNGLPMLTDFGMMMFAESISSSNTNLLIGPPPYLSPERVLGNQVSDPSGDVYSLGVLLYEMLTGTTPYQAETALGYAVHHVAAPLPDIRKHDLQIPVSCENVILKAMSRDPKDRYETAGQFCNALLDGNQSLIKPQQQAVLPIPDKIPPPDEPRIVIDPEEVYKAVRAKRFRNLGKKRVGYAYFFSALFLASLICLGGVLLLYQRSFLPVGVHKNQVLAAFGRLSTATPTTPMQVTLTPKDNSTETLVLTITPVKDNPESLLSETPIASVTVEAPLASPTETSAAISNEPILIYPAHDYMVVSGDTLFDIASKFHADLSEMLEINGLACYQRPSVGVQVFVPDAYQRSQSRPKGSLTARSAFGFTMLTALECMDQVQDLKVSPDGKILAVASGNSIYLWDVGEWKPRLSLQGHIQQVTSLAFSPNGETIATGSDDWTIRIWDTTTGDLLRTAYLHAGKVKAIAYSLSGDLLASVGTDNHLILQDSVTGQVKQDIQGISGLSIVFSPAQESFVVGDLDSIVVFELDQKTARKTLELSANGPVSHLAFDPNGFLLASNKDVWHIPEGRHIYHIDSPSDDRIVFSPDGQVLIVGNRMFNVANGNLIFEIDKTDLTKDAGAAIHISLSGDGNFLFIAGDRATHVLTLSDSFVDSAPADLPITVAEKGDTLYSLANQHGIQLTALLEANHFTCDSPIFSGQHIFIPDDQDALRKTLKVNTSILSEANAVNLKPLWNLDMACARVTGELIFSSDSTKLISGSALWDINTGNILVQTSDIPYTLNGIPDKNTPSPLLVLSPNNELVADHSGNLVLLWDVRSGHILHTYAAEGPIASMAFPPDGENIAASIILGEQAIRVWRINDAKLLWFITGYIVPKINFSLDGSSLIALGGDALRVWNVFETNLRSAVRGVDQRSVLSQDQTLLAYISCVNYSGSKCTEEIVILYNLETDELLPTRLNGKRPLIQDLDFAPSGYLIAGATGIGVSIWDYQKGLLLHWLFDDNNVDNITQITFSPNGELLAAVDEDGTLRIWSVQSEDLLFTQEVGNIDRFAFSPDGTMLAILSKDSIFLWGTQR